MGVGFFGLGANTPLNQVQGTAPDVSVALLDWLQSITFTNVSKAVVNFQNDETPTSFTFQGTWIPFSGQQLEKKEKGERAWKWYTCHALKSIGLNVDDVVTYLGVQYRVDWVGDYSLNGFFEYHMVNDYTGAGP